MFKILIVEDDVKLRDLFSKALIKNGYDVEGVSNGQEGLDAMSKKYYDLIISDIMMPILDGNEFVKEIRDNGNNVPILVISAKSEFDDMKLSFSIGIDDYMIKPININEMVIRVGALLRRAQITNERRQVIGDTLLDCDSLTITTNGESMILPQKEFMLLYKMASSQGKIFTRQQMLDEIWGYDASGDTHTVDVHIGRLREKFRNNPDFEIITIRGIGYKVKKK